METLDREEPTADPDRAIEHRRDVRELARALPALVCLVLFIVWAADQGGFSTTIWYPGALLVLAVVATVAASGWALVGRPSRLVTASLASFAAFTAWCFLSIMWAAVKGDAWDGANRTLLYLTVFALFALWPMRPSVAIVLIAGYATSVAVLGLVTLERAIDAGPPWGSFFFAGQLSAPTDYTNATAALFLLAFWPTLALTMRRELPWFVRGPLLGVAGVLFELSVIVQSRGALFTLPAVALVYFALVPDRRRQIVSSGLVAVATGLSLHALLGVYRAGPTIDALRSARLALLLSFVGLTAAGAVVVGVDRRVRLSARSSRVFDRALLGAGVLAAVIGLAVGASSSPIRHLEHGWHEFTNGSEPAGSSTRLTGLGSNRYDFWRVSLDEFAAHPIGGGGVDNFAVAYVRHRRSLEQPLYPHSLEMRLLAETGVVGTALFLVFILCAFVVVLRGRRGREPLRAAVAAGALVACASWLIHGSVDWLWEIPGLGAPALAFLGLAVGLGARAPASAPAETVRGERARSRRSAAWRLAGAAAVLIAAGSYLFPWLSARAVNAASDSWRADPQHAFALLDQARRLNPLSDQPDLIEGAIANRLGQPRRAEISFTRALRRNPSGWYAHLELGVLEGRAGERAAAQRSLEEAHTLDPREPLIGLALQRLRAGRPLSPAAVDRVLLEEAGGVTRPR